MELRQLRTFVAVAEELSFSAAADRLHVVQSAVSSGIRRLESQLGTPLLDRTTHRVSLTDAGHALLPEARATLAAADSAREAVDAVRGGLRGTVRLGIMQAQRAPGVGVPELLAAFRDAHPLVEVRIRHAGGSTHMAEQIRDGELDLGFLSLTERRPAGLELQRLSVEPIDLVCSIDDPLAARRTIKLSALADATFADLPLGWGTRMAVDRSFAAAGVRRTIAYEVNDTSSLVEFVRHGLAVALIPRSIAGNIEGLAFVPVRHHRPVFEVSFATPTERRMSAAAQALRDLVVRTATGRGAV